MFDFLSYAEHKSEILKNVNEWDFKKMQIHHKEQ